MHKIKPNTLVKTPRGEIGRVDCRQAGIYRVYFADQHVALYTREQLRVQIGAYAAAAAHTFNGVST